GCVDVVLTGAVLTLEDVPAGARFPDKRVVAVPEQGRIVAAAAGDEVVAIAAKQPVVAVAAGDGVVARAAVDGELDETSEAVPGSDGVIAAVGINDEVLGGADVEEEGRGGDAGEAHA